MTKIIVHGYGGRLGHAVCAVIDRTEGVHIAAGIDISAPSTAKTFPTYTRIADCDMPADVIIDCSLAAAVPSVLEYALEKGIPAIVCTTGLDESTRGLINEASTRIPLFVSANMSLGVNLVADLLEKAVAVLADSGFDVEIVEKHHNRKLDAPSGTALMLADAVNGAAGGKYEYIYDRTPHRRERGANELGIHAIRGGTIIGEHSVIFAGADEVIEIKHSAYSKEVFAVGAVRAARYIVGKSPGLYDMRSLIRES